MLVHLCPRCFWLAARHGMKTDYPMPMYTRLRNQALKLYDRCRRANRGRQEKIMRGKLPGTLVPQSYARKFRRGLVYENKEIGLVITGKIDDCFHISKGDYYVPIKINLTASRGTNEAADKELEISKMNLRLLLLNVNGYNIFRFGVISADPRFSTFRSAGIIAGHPVRIGRRAKSRLCFKLLATNIFEADGFLKRAAKIAHSPKPPRPQKDCKNCRYYEERLRILEKS